MYIYITLSPLYTKAEMTMQQLPVEQADLDLLQHHSINLLVEQF